jgi:hypothetical protein
MSRRRRTPVLPTRHELIDEWLSRGNAITQCAPGVSGHVSEWDTLPGRIDNCPEPLCADVNVSSWTVGTSVAGSINEAREESERESNY